MTQATSDSEEDEEMQLLKDVIAPSPDVFSYFLLTAPGERKKYNRFTTDAFTSYLLVFVVLFIQCTLLFCVSNKVIAKNIKWQNGMMNTGKSWNLVGSPPEGCNDGKSLCTSDNGTFTCAPPSVQLMGRWDLLDTNKDGVWSRSEVMKSRESLKCKFAVDPVEVFDVLGVLLQERKKHIFLHSDVKNGKAIPKDYFTYIMGDVSMCGYRNGDMCGNLVKRGFFDAAIIHGTVPRVGTTVRSALKYCHNLLDQGGFCERMLPSSYSTWKIKSVQECREAEFDEFVYKDPNNGGVKSLLTVDYKARERYEIAQTPVFRVYKTCIIFLWMLLVVSQLRDVSNTALWTLQIPTTDATPRPRKGEDFHSISKGHRCALIVVSMVRVCMLVTLLYVGLQFLARQTDYIGLLLDGVSLIFIIEVEEIVYTRVIRQDARLTWEGRDPIPLHRVGFLAGMPDILDLVFVTVLLFMAIGFLWYYTQTLVLPLYDALQCSCLSEGPKCYEAQYFDKNFWDNYWEKEVPTSIENINDLKNGKPLPGVHATKSRTPHFMLHSGASSHRRVVKNDAGPLLSNTSSHHHVFHDHATPLFSSNTLRKHHVYTPGVQLQHPLPVVLQ